MTSPFNKKNISRRPLKSRNNSLIKSMAAWLNRKGITPNQISLLSILNAALAGGCILFGAKFYMKWWLLLLAALFIQCRLLCNLIDGLVAIEGAKKTKSGELYNDIPDRFSDVFIIVTLGYALPWGNLSISLGWLAATLAVMTAYVRTLNTSLGIPVDFRGPMAKPQRMALVTAACTINSIEMFFWSSHYSLILALILLIIGTSVTIMRRISFGYHYLENVNE